MCQILNIKIQNTKLNAKCFYDQAEECKSMFILRS